MRTFRYIHAGIVVAAVLVVVLMQAPLWQGIVIVAFTLFPFVTNEVQMAVKSRQLATAAEHSSNSVQDALFHAYKERP